MNSRKILEEIRDNIEDVIKQRGPVGKSLWTELLELHPVDIADFLAELNHAYVRRLFMVLPPKMHIEVFNELSHRMKVFTLSFMPEAEQVDAFQTLSADELTDLFDLFSDEELKKYLNLLHKKVREKVLALLKFDPDSAGGIMHTDVITLMEDFTVEKKYQAITAIKSEY